MLVFLAIYIFFNILRNFFLYSNEVAVPLQDINNIINFEIIILGFIVIFLNISFDVLVLDLFFVIYILYF